MKKKEKIQNQRDNKKLLIGIISGVIFGVIGSLFANIIHNYYLSKSVYAYNTYCVAVIVYIAILSYIFYKLLK